MANPIAASRPERCSSFLGHRTQAEASSTDCRKSPHLRCPLTRMIPYSGALNPNRMESMHLALAHTETVERWRSALRGEHLEAINTLASHCAGGILRTQ